MDNYELKDDEIRRRWATFAQQEIEKLDEVTQKKAEIVFVNVLLADNIYQMRKVLDASAKELPQELLNNSTQMIDNLTERIHNQREELKQYD
jgi:hypothetical protein